jgi:hypothetical protein
VARLLAVVVVIGLFALGALLFLGTGTQPFVSEGNVTDGWAIKGDPWTPDYCSTMSCDDRIALATRALGAGAAAVVSAAIYTEDTPLMSGPIGGMRKSGVVVLTLGDGTKRAFGIVCDEETCELGSKPSDPLYKNSGGIQP